MAEVEKSILKDIKKAIGIAPDYPEFDQDIILFVNAVFSTLNQLGLGPDEGFRIEDEEAEWADFLEGDKRLNNIKSYLVLRTRLLFDPPSTSFAITAMREQATELEWRINAQREHDTYPKPLLQLEGDPDD